MRPQLVHVVADGWVVDNGTVASPHCIQCLKPVSPLKAGIFNACSIAEQLKCGGVLEAARVSRAGFLQKCPHADFAARCGALEGSALKQSRQNKKHGWIVRSSFVDCRESFFTSKMTSKNRLQSSFRWAGPKCFCPSLLLKLWKVVTAKDRNLLQPN